MKTEGTGKLKIGDNWNAITIIALSQNNPLKAIAEFVENSIDAGATNITVIRGKEKGEYFLKIIDDGSGINDFKYVATHIGDSIKRQLKKQGVQGLQGEFGIGLLSFWTVGEELVMTSTGSKGITQRMNLIKNNPSYKITEVKTLFEDKTGTELLIKPILSGIKQINGEKIQNYLASELRDRISKTEVKIKIIDKTSRKEFIVEPRKYTGRLLHNLPECKSPLGDIYVELYLSEQSSNNKISLYKLGTRVLEDITGIEQFQNFPWNSDYLEGIIDISFLQLTPGTRDGIIFDDAFDSLIYSLSPLAEHLENLVKEIKTAAEEEASRNILSKVKKALKEAFLVLPLEQYSWLDIESSRNKRKGKYTDSKLEDVVTEEQGAHGDDANEVEGIKETDPAQKETQRKESEQKEFFELAGPLYRVNISPGSATVGIDTKRKFKVIARDKKKRVIDHDLFITWSIIEGNGELIGDVTSEFIEFKAPNEPGITTIGVKVEQYEVTCQNEAIITVTDELIKDQNGDREIEKSHGLPGYTFEKQPGKLWRSRYDKERSIIIINNGHADFIYANRNKMRKLRYILKLYSKELVIENFIGASKDELLERMIELLLYTEENLR